MNNKHLWIVAILFISFLAHSPTFKNGFINDWDSEDYPYIKDYDKVNNLIKEFSIENIKTDFTQQFDGHYHPLTMLSLTLDYKIGKLNPVQYHITNMLLHLLNTFLVFSFLYLITKNLSVAVISSLLFGVHTLHVESVSWLSERKTLLYTTFFLFSLVMYIKYIHALDCNKDNKKIVIFYVSSIILFILSLLSKSQAVALAPTLVAIDFLLNRAFFKKRVFIEKIPFFILSILFGTIAWYAQRVSWNLSGSPYSLIERIIFACYGYTQYFLKLLFPVNLSAKYLYPELINGHIPYEYNLYVLSALLVVGIMVYCLKHNKQIAFGLLFFSINIFFLLKISQVPYGDYIMADRYAYVPSIGFFYIIGIGYTNLYDKKYLPKRILLTIMIAYVGTVIVFTYNRTQIWKDDLSFYSDLKEKSPMSPDGWINVAVIKENEGDYLEALKLYNKYIKINSRYGLSYYNRGVLKSYHFNDYDGAVSDFTIALSKKLNLLLKFGAHFERAVAYKNAGKYSDALKDCYKAIELLSDIDKPKPYFKDEAEALKKDVLDLIKKRSSGGLIH